MKSTLKNSILVIVSLSLVLGCSLFNRIKKSIDESQKPKVIDATDGKSQLTVPGSWEKHTDLNKVASIQVANLMAEQYTVVITDSKDDLAANVTLDDFATVVRDSTKEKFDDAVVGESKSITVNGYPAIQFEVQGSDSNIKAKLLYTIVEGPKNFHQVVAWSIASEYDGNKKIFLDVINSFKETDGTTSSAPPPPVKKR